MFLVFPLCQWSFLSGQTVRIIVSFRFSTISSGYSALSAMTLEDVVKMKYKHLTEFRATIISKLIGKFFTLHSLILFYQIDDPFENLIFYMATHELHLLICCQSINNVIPFYFFQIDIVTLCTKKKQYHCKRQRINNKSDNATIHVD